MGLQTKTIGRVTTDHGPYDPDLAYGKKFQCELFGCVWESLHDNNNTAPAVWDGGDTITPNLVDWKKQSGSYESWLMNRDKPASTGTTGDYPYNGLGRIVLKKKYSENSDYANQPILEQADFDDANNNHLTNTVFVIKYDFVLTEDITLGSGCVLKFEGGSISGAYTVTGTNTLISGEYDFDGITLAGSFSNGTIVANLKEGSANKTANTTLLQNLVNIFSDVIIPDGEYYVGEVSIGYSSKCNSLRGISRKDTILHSDKIYLGKSAVVDGTDVGLSPKIQSMSLISATIGSNIGIEVWGYNVLLSDLFIKDYQFGIRKSYDNGELITSQIEKVVIIECTHGIDLVTIEDVQTTNYYSINANIIKDCFILNCTDTGIRIMGTSNIIRDCALQNSPKNIVLMGANMNSDGTDGRTVYDYNTTIENCYFEALVENNVVTGIDIRIYNKNAEQLQGVTIKDNYHKTAVSGESSIYDLVKLSTPGSSNANIEQLSRIANIDVFKKYNEYYALELIEVYNTASVETINSEKYLKSTAGMIPVYLQRGRTYKITMNALKTEGSVGVGCVVTLTNNAGDYDSIVVTVDSLNTDKFGTKEFTPDTTGLYYCIPNTTEAFYLNDFRIF